MAQLTIGRNSLTALALVAGLSGAAAPALAETLSLGQDWRFHKGDVAGAEKTDFKDAGWRHVVVPHDFSIEDSADGKPPFDPATVGAADSGYIPGGIGWYRRHLTFNAGTAKKIVLVDFEAVYMDADIWINGEHVAKHHYGYTAFQVDLTHHLHAGDNVLAVRINHEDSASRWYAGSGIIRPVTMEILPAVHIASAGATVTTPRVSPESADVQVATPLVNSLPRPVHVTLESTVFDRSGRKVAADTAGRDLAAGEQAVMVQTFHVTRPELWDTDSPNLYRLAQTLHAAKADESRKLSFGIRTISLDPERGLLLNGRRVLLKGGNIHHDTYMLGTAGFPRAEARKLEWMKAAGYNAVRSAHNPLSQASLEAADRLGLLVIDEAFDVWSTPKRPKDYARFFATDWQDDIQSLVTSGRNHPSVFAWSIGNEIPEQGTPEAGREAKMIAARVRALDPTRAITQAVSTDTPGTAEDFAQLDIGGYNYLPQIYARDHASFPKRMMMSTESYPDKVFDYWQPTKTMPWVIGDFVWTAVDYLGEASIGGVGFSKDWQHLGPYPWHLAWCGEIDALGRMRPNAYYRQIVWGDSKYPVAAFVRRPGPDPEPGAELAERQKYWVMQDLHPSWTWPGYEGKPVDIVVYSELPEVELFLNGRSLGRKQVGDSSRDQVSFSVPYEPGVLKAVGYRDGKAASTWTLETTGAPAAIALSVDRRHIAADGMDLAFVTAKLVDAKGRAVYNEADDKLLHVRIAGAGVLAGVGNGKPYGTESFQSGDRTTFHGEAVAAVRAGTRPGDITAIVSADGLPAQKLVLHADAARNAGR